MQGEGFHAGTPAVFVRFSGCNLKCPFCDTRHDEGREMSEDEIVSEVRAYPARHVVITGGEPSLWLTESLVEKLHAAGKYVAVETNGTRPLPAVDWVTLSPKDAFVPAETAQVRLTACHEIKLVFTGDVPLKDYGHIRTEHRFIQPCDTGDSARNAAIMKAAVRYCLEHPEWRLSIQLHKVVGIQ